MITNKYLKTSALATMLLFGASALAYEPPVAIAGGNDCSNAVAIDDYMSIDYTGHAGDTIYRCIKGDNLNPGVGDDLQPDLFNGDCWVGAATADHSVWYKFGTDANKYYTVTTNLGANSFDGDTQLAIWDDCSGGKVIACNDDAEDPCDNGVTGANLAAATSFKGTGGTVYIQVDMFGTTQGRFLLAAFETPTYGVPTNDDPDNAINVTDAYNDLSSDKMVSSGWYNYGLPYYDTLGNLDSSNGPTWSSVFDDNSGTNTYDPAFSPCNNGVLAEHHDVWFTLKYDADINGLLSVYNKRGDVAFALQAFYGTPNLQNDTITGLTYLGCSFQDGLSANGGDEDWAIGDFFNHPRLNLNELQNNTATNLDGKFIYIRVYQFTRVLVGSTETAAPPCYGFFKLAFEQWGVECEDAPDARGVDRLDCQDSARIPPLPASLGGGPLTDGSIFVPGLCNAGMRGGLSAIQGTTAPASATGRAGEPGEFEVPGGSTIEYEDCDEDGGTIFVNDQNFFNNNSIIYNFEVTSEVRSITLDDTLLSITLFDSLVVIPDFGAIPDTDIVATISVCDSLLRTRNLLPGNPGLPALSETPVVGGLLEDLCTFDALCGADVKFTFDNFKYCGVMGHTFEVLILPYTETGGFGAPMASYMGGSVDDACDTCWSMRSANFFLPPGKYSMVLDGEDGNLFSTDLTMETTFFIPGTTVECVEAPAPRKANRLFDLGLKPTAIGPNPATNMTNVTFEVPRTGNVAYTMVDLNGRVVDQGKFLATEGVNQRSFDVSNHASGFYMLNMTYNDLTTTIKLMKQ